MDSMIILLPKETLQAVLTFVGPNHFLPTALSSSFLYNECSLLFDKATELQKLLMSIPLTQLALNELRKTYRGRQLWNKNVWSDAAYHGNIAVLEWLTQATTVVGCAHHLDENALAKLARKGRLHCIQWAWKNGSPWNQRVCSNAAEGGHLELLQWARTNGCPWDKYVCSHAAEGGHLEILQWARANGCPWDKYVCSYAAQNGHLEVLQWARVNGCP